MKVSLVLVRHGETNDNKNKILQGWRDVPLNETGRVQAQAIGKYLKSSNVKFEAIYTSDLCRASETADIIAKELNDQDIPIFIDKRIRERNLGIYEGKSVTEYKSRPISSEDDGVETHDKLRARLIDVVEGLSKFVSENSRTSKDEPLRILFTSHGGPLKALIGIFAHTKGITAGSEDINLKKISTTWIPNCSHTVVDLELLPNFDESISSSEGPRNVKCGTIVRLADTSFIPNDLLHNVAGDEVASK